MWKRPAWTTTGWLAAFDGRCFGLGSWLGINMEFSFFFYGVLLLVGFTTELDQRIGPALIGTSNSYCWLVVT